MANILFINADQQSTQTLISAMAASQPADRLRLTTMHPHNLSKQVRERFEILVGAADDGLFMAEATAGIDAVYLTSGMATVKYLHTLSWALTNFKRPVKRLILTNSAASDSEVKTVTPFCSDRLAVLTALGATHVAFVLVQQVAAKVADRVLIETVDARSQVLRQVIELQQWNQWLITLLSANVAKPWVGIAN
ncbi:MULTISPECIES: Rossmann-fold NAD(P)-binding domain-containing protein [Furfurilactobacillus]|uniref:NAD(P)H-binding protein n=1 Tax=Furfurilactobacillus rossiae TaxID=231049 RepID=A0A7C9IYC8_9LACO|nr:hypothetical protein [Furfurilactobacillus milii]MYV04835.1 hypothetical protein [Furfurilactobacillus milii]